MPTPLHELLTVVREISVYADIGLETPVMRQQALLAIQECCEEIDDTLKGISESPMFDGASSGSLH